MKNKKDTKKDFSQAKDSLPLTQKEFDEKYITYSVSTSADKEVLKLKPRVESLEQAMKDYNKRQDEAIEIDRIRFNKKVGLYLLNLVLSACIIYLLLS